jgi:hypothetical protein
MLWLALNSYWHYDVDMTWQRRARVYKWTSILWFFNAAVWMFRGVTGRSSDPGVSIVLSLFLLLPAIGFLRAWRGALELDRRIQAGGGRKPPE